MTSRQIRLLALMGVTLLAVVGVLGWSVWTTLNTPTATVSPLPTLSPLTLAPPTPTAAPPIPMASPTPAFDFSEVGEISAAVSRARELLPRWETPFTFVTEYELSVILYHRYEEVQPFPVREQRTLQILDLWPTSPVRADVVAQAQAAGAIYISEEGQLYLRRDWAGSADILCKLLAYGYASALPEQYGNLNRLRAEAPTLDQRLALDALAEGDAWFTLTRYAGLAPDDPATAELSALIARAAFPQWRADDTVLDLNWLSLTMGSRFAAARYADGGIPALDAALRRPPRSTEQLLHPERYAADDHPVLIEPAELQLGRGWELTLTETLGEALMQITFDAWSPIGSAPIVSGWGGDLLQIWDGPDGARLYLWQTAWDAGQDAATLLPQFKELLPRRIGYVRDTTLPAGLPHGNWWASFHGAAFLYRQANRIWLVWGDDPESVRAAAATLP